MRKTLPSGQLPSFHWITDKNVALDAPLTYLLAGFAFVVPRGFVSDFASIPKLFWGLFGPTGKYTWAAILHDWFCKLLPSKKCPVSARDADRYFRLACAELGVDPITRWLLWTGVRWGALFNRHRRAGWWRDLPLIAVWSVLALPIVVPAAVGGLVALVPYGVYRLVSVLLSRA